MPNSIFNHADYKKILAEKSEIDRMLLEVANIMIDDCDRAAVAELIRRAVREEAKKYEKVVEAARAAWKASKSKDFYEAMKNLSNAIDAAEAIAEVEK